MENLLNLLFELSSEERMGILFNLKAAKMKLSDLSRKRKLTATEASRHLQRLSEAKLIQRDADGFFSLTGYGELSLSLLDSLTFTSANREYFLSHDASGLPGEYKSRLGDLGVCSFQGDVISTLAYDEDMFRAADSYVWAIADQFHYSARPIVEEKIRLGVDFRSIFPENVVPPKGFKPAEGVARRVLPKVDFHIIVTDKEAAFGLPFMDGRMDYAQFASKDDRFREWCHDLFQFCWEKAKPVHGPLTNIS
jgi:predicted transcriptional regulator